MVVQVLANLSPAMIPDYAQAPAVYVETDGNMCKEETNPRYQAFARQLTY